MPKKSQVRKYLRRRKHGRVLYTRLSHGDGEIPVPVWHKMLKQMGITQEEFNAGI